ncbi:hypothetical protein ACINWC743_A0505 [Acinetobacter sp. WC-743]|nr:hypothetical protein ACINWC743_A0505 [Acinetobacter sp. WC-743]
MDSVHYRIGSLEMNVICIHVQSRVHYRIGSLENFLVGKTAF